MKKVLFSGMALLVFGLSSCESTGPASDASGFYGPEPATTADRAAYMQQRIGQINRSAIR